MFDITTLLRNNIKNIQPYSSARDEYTGKEGVFLDANENPFGSVSGGHYNRYPDPLQREVKAALAQLKRVEESQIFLGNGSDEPIDLLYRAFCNPDKDNVIINPPTYGMYQVSADINDVEVRKVNLTEDFQLQVSEILKAVDGNTKMIFICSPNNPSGNLMRNEDIEQLLRSFNGIVVVDEAYIDFADTYSFSTRLNEFPNLFVLQTFSKAWGMAALRLGMGYANAEIIKILNKIKYPYNINLATQELALKALQNVIQKEKYVADILEQRSLLIEELSKISKILKIYPSDSNQVLIKVKGAGDIYKKLIGQLVIVRDRSKVTLCDDCLRISVGTNVENEAFLRALKTVLEA